MGLTDLEARVVACERCPRLVAWRTLVAARPPARFADDRYWARPVPGSGDPRARLHVLAKATAAHGGNRTGRAMSGNATADWVMHALHALGLASLPRSTGPGDGLALRGVWVASAVRCPVPDDRATAEERHACAAHLRTELEALQELRVVLALGGEAFATAARMLDVRPRPRFGHGTAVRAADGRCLVGSYHPSPRNTNTGRLTREAFTSVVEDAAGLAGLL